MPVPMTVCLVFSQVYHAWNQLRTLGVPISTWPSIMCAVVQELLNDNPVRGRLMLGAMLWAMQALVMDLQAVLKDRSRVRQLLTHPDAMDACSVN